MSIIGGIGKSAKQMATGVGRLLSPNKKQQAVQSKSFLQESPEEYAQRLMNRRNMRHQVLAR